MATVVRYVNTASAGGDGTTNLESGGTAAYASLNAWNAAEATDLVTAGDSHIVYCTTGSGTAADTTAVTLNGWTTGASNTLTIRAHPDDKATSKWDDTKYRLVVADAAALTVQNATYISIENLQFNRTDSGADTYTISVSSANPVFKGCFIRAIPSAAADTASDLTCVGSGTSADVALYNCILEIRDSGSNNLDAIIPVELTPGKGHVENCTIVVEGVTSTNSTTTGGVYLNVNNSTVRNTIVDVSGSTGVPAVRIGASATTYQITNNVYTDTTDHGSGSYIYQNRNSQSVTFVDKANSDYQLSADDTSSLNYAEDRSYLGVSSVHGQHLGFDLLGQDINGYGREDSWDVGATIHGSKVKHVYRFVNTASAGGDGTTVGESGPDAAYTSISAWYAAQGTALYLGEREERHTVWCTTGSGSAADDTYLSLTNVYPSPEHYLTIRAYRTDKATSTWDDTKYRIRADTSTRQYALNLTADFSRVLDLQIEGIGNRVGLNFSADFAELDRCFLLNRGVFAAGAIIYGIQGIINGRITNSVVMVKDTNPGTRNQISRYCYIGYFSGAYCVNNTFYFDADTAGSTYLLNETRKNAEAFYYNCIFDSSNASGVVGNFPTSMGTAYIDYCATDDSINYGTHARINQTFTFVDAANYNLALATTDTGARGYGFAMRDAGEYDINGDLRPPTTWDIGADQVTTVESLHIHTKSGGGTGETNELTSNDFGGAAYASVTAWEAAEQTNLVTADKCSRGLITGVGVTAGVLITGWTSDASHYPIIQGNEATGNAADTAWKGSVFYFSNSGGHTLTLQQAYAYARGVQVYSGANVSGGCLKIDATGVIVDGCYLRHWDPAPSANIAILDLTSNATNAVVVNNIISTTNGSSGTDSSYEVDLVGLTTSSTGAKIYNNTLYAANYALGGTIYGIEYASGASPELRNNLFYAINSAVFTEVETIASQDENYNASNLSGLTGANSRNSQTFIWDGAWAKLDGTDTGAADRGTPALDTVEATRTDIVGNIRHLTNSIGASEPDWIVRYVNPSSSAGGSGRTSAEAGVERAYASLNEVAANEVVHVLRDGRNFKILCTSGSSKAADTTRAVFNILQVASKHPATFVIQALPEDKASSRWSDTKYRLQVASQNQILSVNVAGTIKDLQVYQTTTTDHDEAVYTALNFVIVDSCFVRASGYWSAGIYSFLGRINYVTPLTTTNNIVAVEHLLNTEGGLSTLAGISFASNGRNGAKQFNNTIYVTSPELPYIASYYINNSELADKNNLIILDTDYKKIGRRLESVWATSGATRSITSHTPYSPGSGTELANNMFDVKAEEVFVDKDNLDLTIKADSPAADFGLDVGGDLTTDINGKTVATWQHVGASTPLIIEERYVNTASTAGGTGTTAADSGDNRAYASLNEWAANEVKDLTQENTKHTVYCTVGSGSAADTTATTITGWNPSPGRELTIKAYDDPTNGDQRAVMPYDSTIYRLEVSGATDVEPLVVEDDFVVIEGIQVKATGTGATTQAVNAITLDGTSNTVVTGVLAVAEYSNASNDSGSMNAVLLTGTGTDNTIVGTVGYCVNASTGVKDTAVAINVDGTASTKNNIYNCTAESANATTLSAAFNRGSNDTVSDFTNCLGLLNSHTATTAVAFRLASGTNPGGYNASDDATAVGSAGSNRTSQTFTFQALGSHDYLITNADAGAKGYGEDLRADADYAVTTYFNEAWDVPDIGATQAPRIVRYVNTASPPGGNGTTNGEGAGDANRAYSSLNEADANEAASNLTTTRDTFTVYCTTGSGTAADTSTANWTSWTANNIWQFRIIAADTDRAGALWDATKYRLEITSSSSVPLFLSMSNAGSYPGAWVDGLQVKCVQNTTLGSAGIRGGAAGLKVSNSHVQIIHNSTGSTIFEAIANYNGFLYLANNVVWITGTTPTPLSVCRIFPANGAAATPTSEYYNNTVYLDPAVSIATSPSTVGVFLTNAGSYSASNIMKNNLVVTHPDVPAFVPRSGSGYHADSTHNVSNDDTAPGTNSLQGYAQFADPDNGDFRLHIRDDVALDFGADLSQDAYLPISTGIGGNQIDVWSKGAIQAPPKEVLRVVGYNTAVPSGGTGKYLTTAPDYADRAIKGINEVVSGHSTDLVAAGKRQQFKHHRLWLDDESDAVLTITGWTTDVEHTLALTEAPDTSMGDVSAYDNTSTPEINRILNNVTGIGVDIQQQHCKLSGWTIILNMGGTTVTSFRGVRVGQNTVFENSMVHFTNGSSILDPDVKAVEILGGGIVRNTRIHAKLTAVDVTDYAGVLLNGTSGTGNAYLVNSIVTLYLAGSGSQTATGLILGNTSGDAPYNHVINVGYMEYEYSTFGTRGVGFVVPGGTPSSLTDYNTSTDATAPGTNSLTNVFPTLISTDTVLLIVPDETNDWNHQSHPTLDTVWTGNGVILNNLPEVSSVVGLQGNVRTYPDIGIFTRPKVVDYYVNTASTAGGNGTTSAEVGEDRAFESLKTAMDTLSTLPLWRTWETPRVWVTTGTGTAADVTPAGQYVAISTPNATDIFPVIIEAMPGEEAGYVWDNTKYRLVDNDSTPFSINVQGLTLRNVQIEGHNFGSSGVITVSNPRSLLIEGCYFRLYSDYTGTSTWQHYGVSFSSGTKSTFRNNMVYYENNVQNSSYVRGLTVYGSWDVYNNTVIVTGTNVTPTSANNAIIYGGGASGGVPHIYNNLGWTDIIPDNGLYMVTGGYTPWEGYNVTNRSNILNADSTNKENATIVFEDPDNDNYQLSYSDASAKGYGLDLSENSKVLSDEDKSTDTNLWATFTVDMSGATRTVPWDVGATIHAEQSMVFGNAYLFGASYIPTSGRKEALCNVSLIADSDLVVQGFKIGRAIGEVRNSPYSTTSGEKLGTGTTLLDAEGRLTNEGLKAVYGTSLLHDTPDLSLLGAKDMAGYGLVSGSGTTTLEGLKKAFGRALVERDGRIEIQGLKMAISTAYVSNPNAIVTLTAKSATGQALLQQLPQVQITGQKVLVGSAVIAGTALVRAVSRELELAAVDDLYELILYVVRNHSADVSVGINLISDIEL